MPAVPGKKGESALRSFLWAFAILSLVACDVLASQHNAVRFQHGLSGRNPAVIHRAVLQSFDAASTSPDAGFDREESIETLSPPLQEAPKTLSFPDAQLDTDPPSIAEQRDLALAHRTPSSDLRDRGSGCTGVTEAGKILIDGIAHILQQSQSAWTHLENAANLTRRVQESLSTSFGDQLLARPITLRTNTTMQLRTSADASRARAGSSQDAWWFELINHNGNATFNPDPKSYRVFRNVKDFGAKGE